ncbi:MAG: response regulator [Patescibacteria group bacterium]|jgi:DNA-binding response OmpR family regulator
MIKVLVAEDDRFLSKAYEVKLKKEGFEPILVANGEEAIAKAKSEKPDIILLDLVMPKIDGFEALAELKQNSETKSIPVIILSNLGQEDDIKKGKELGAEDYLVKSNIAINSVVAKIREVLDRQKNK